MTNIVGTSEIIKCLIDDKLCLIEAINRKDLIISELKSKLDERCKECQM